MASFTRGLYYYDNKEPEICRRMEKNNLLIILRKWQPVEQ